MKIVAATALGALLLVLPAPVFALATESFGNAPVTKQPDWAEGVVAVINLKSRVYSFWVNGNETFFYRGDAQAVNEALRKYAAVKSDVRQLILLPGSEKRRTFRGGPVGFDWQFHVPSGIYKAVTGRKHAVMTVYLNAPKPRRPPNEKLIGKWIGDLDNDSFEKREQARVALEKLGLDAKPLLRAALKARPALEARRRIEALLAKLPGLDVTDLEIPKGLTVVSADDLLAASLTGLKSPNATVCGLAVQELSGLARYSDKVVPALTEMLAKDKKEYVRRVAASCLAQHGAKARPAVPKLKQGLDDPDANVRNAFQAALKQIEAAKDQPAQPERLKRDRTILQEINELRKAPGGR